jgi:thiol-disulfide isomerase/thioredoxin
MDGTPAEAQALFAGRPALVSFIASWCTPCSGLQADMATVHQTYGDALALVSIAADTDSTREDLERFLTDTDTTWPVVFDPQNLTWRNYAVREAPAIGIVDSAGSLVRLWPGGTDLKTIEQTLTTLITLPN